MFNNDSVPLDTGIAEFVSQENKTDGTLTVVHRLMPFPDETPIAVMSREVFCRSDVYSNSTGISYAINPLTNILANPVIGTVFNYFRLSSFDAIEVRIENIQSKSFLVLMLLDICPGEILLQFKPIGCCCVSRMLLMLPILVLGLLSCLTWQLLIG